jgi:antitoxin MazE
MLENAMKTRVEKWGKGAAIKLPPSVMKAAHLVLGQTLEIRIENGRIVAEPSQLMLGELVAGITPENLPDETEFEPPVGRETLL